MPVRSRTWRDLRRLLNELPPSRVRFLVLVLAASFLQGLMDILLVGLLARLVGLMAGVKLADQLPGIRVFGGDMLDQAGWLLGLLIAAFWLTSGLRFGVALLHAPLGVAVVASVPLSASTLRVVIAIVFRGSILVLFLRIGCL